MKLVIPGEPKAKQRPRHGKGFTYTPKQTVDYENYVKWCFVESKGKLMDGQLKAEIKAFFPIPKSYTKKKKKAIENGLRPTKKPDLDNIAKSVLDSLNGLAYKDDSQVVILNIEKHYGDPRVEIEIEEVK